MSCYFDWRGDGATFDVLFYLMILWIHKCGTVLPYYQKDLDVYFTQQGINFTEVWYIMWFFAYTLIWYHTHTHTHTHTHREREREASIMTHSYKCIITPPVMCSQQLSLLQWMNEEMNSWYQKFTFGSVFCFQKLFTCKIYPLIRCCKTRFFSETQIILRETV